MTFDGYGGDIVEYLGKFDGRTSFARFSGEMPFDMLWRKGFLSPYVSQVRLFSNGGFDQCYGVLEDAELEGLELQAHSGTPGVHSFKEVFSDDFSGWETYSLCPDPKPRLPLKKNMEDLNEKHIVLMYSEQDNEDEGGALAFLRMEKDGLKYVVQPALLYDPSAYGVKCETHPVTRELITPEQHSIELAKVHGIEEVVSAITVREFFGIEMGFVDGDRDDWHRNQSVCIGEPGHEWLTGAGINVSFYDLDRAQFLD